MSDDLQTCLQFCSDEMSYIWVVSSKFTLMLLHHWHMAFTSKLTVCRLVAEGIE